MKNTTAAIIAAALLAGCHGMAPQNAMQEPLQGSAALQPTKGRKAFGEATFEQMGDKAHVMVNAQGLKPNQEHGFHIHEAGDCSSGDGMSAKGHYNPQKKSHGQPGSPERHAGDMPSLKADANGKAKVDATLDIITVSPGPTSVVGKGLIVHAQPDDYRTQPTGNAGARLACAVIQGS